MDLIINGRRATLKKNSSFDYVSENRAFSDADDYTLSISLPLAGCDTNLDIFGFIGRMDADSRKIVMDATVRDGMFFRNGVITVVEVTDKEVKCQFLEGRSVQNFMTTFDDIYINELDLGSYPSSTLPDSVSYGDVDHGADCVPLPWVNNSADGIINNEVVVDNGIYKWSDSTKAIGKLSYMPYLIYLAKKICDEVGYSYDFSQWENSDERFLLICNALPASWNIPQFARALPHWSVSEFFTELEKILVCEFNINHKEKHIGMTFSRNVESVKKQMKIYDVLDSFTSDISYEDSLCQFKGIANIRYANRGDQKWKLEQCQWLINLMKEDGKFFKEFQTENDFQLWQTSKFGPLGPLITGKDWERGEDIGTLIHIIESDRYLMWHVYYGNLQQYPNMYFYELLEINRFGDVINNKDSNNDIELQMVPVCVQSTDDTHGLCVFLDPSAFNENEDVDDDGIRQPMAYSNFLKGEPDSSAEYYDMILLAYWDGHSANQGDTSYSGNILPPCPIVDYRFSLRNRYANYLSGISVNPLEKMKISWLSSSIPDVRSVFHINGKRYICEKITATFTENGMSQLLKGEFYPLVDQN